MYAMVSNISGGGLKLDFQAASFRIKAFIIRKEEYISGSGISGTDKTVSNV